MNGRLACIAAAACAAFAVGNGAKAGVTILPAFTGTTECVSGALVVDAAGPCVAGGATASFTASPFAGVQAQAIGGPTISNGGQAFLTYFYTIDGPDTGPVGVDIFTDLLATVAGGPDNVAFASLFDTEGHQICATLGQAGCGGVSSRSPGELTEMETPGLVYKIELEVEASEVGGAGNSVFASADPLILVDPILTIDPELYTIRLSDGVANALPPAGGPAPEPGVWAMLLAGFAGLGAALRGRRRALQV
jgi:hypothetical protein